MLLNLPALLSRFHPNPSLGRAGRAATPAPAEEAEAEAPCGCGWFDSSHELQQGLLVREHAQVDSLSAELPLDCWLALKLAEPRVTRAS